MIINGTVIKIEKNTDIAKKGGGSYKGTLLVYKDSGDGKIKDRAFHNKSLEFNKSVAVSLDVLTDGDAFVMELEKKGDFWNVIKLEKGNNNATASSSAPKYSGASMYDNKQDLIIRQNCVGNAVKFLEITKAKSPAVADVIAVAKQFEEYVNTGNIAQSKDDVPPEFADMEDDIPF